MASNPIADLFSARQWTGQDVLARKKNLTGVPSAAAGDLGVMGQPEEDPLTTSQNLMKRKKLMSSAMGDQQLSATQFLTGNGTMFPAASVRGALGMAY